MKKDYYQRKKTRLAKIEERKSFKQALLFIFLTILSIVSLIFLGIPALTKLVIFLGEIKSSEIKPTASDTLSPPAPLLEPLNEAVNTELVTIKGFSEEGSLIKLVVNGIISVKHYNYIGVLFNCAAIAEVGEPGFTFMACAFAG